MAVVDLVGNARERAAHLALDGVGRQQRLRIHGIHVVDAVQVRRDDAVGPQCADDDIEDDRPAQAADVDGPGRRLRVVDDLGTADGRRQLVGPIHRVLGDLVDPVSEVPGGDSDQHLLALLVAEQGATDR